MENSTWMHFKVEDGGEGEKSLFAEMIKVVESVIEVAFGRR
jgi:hypothetical protein